MTLLQTKAALKTRRETTRHKVALSRSIGSRAIELTSALLGRDGDRALNVLLRASNDGWELRDIEKSVIAPAVARLCQMRVRGRLDDLAFEQGGQLAETV